MHETSSDSIVTDELTLNYHLMHPGNKSGPGDPNVAFYLDGVYHLHYILCHPWQGKHSFAFVHVTSPDMLHWTWQTTKLQPSFTNHGTYSGTGFITKEGQPAAIYHGTSGRNQIAIAKDNHLNWEKPYPVEPKTAEGQDVDITHWDPDCFLIGDTYYAISGGQNPPLIKSKDLTSWTFVGNFLKYELPDVAIGEDISCPNFFPLNGKYMLLCISHQFGCRYYLGNWDTKAEQFVPETHGRMNWKRPEQCIYDLDCRDFFAPESLLTPDGRRVMWAWLVTLDEAIRQRTVQCLPRELSLSEDGGLRFRPLRELESLRQTAVTLKDLGITSPKWENGKMITPLLTKLNYDAFEVRITIDRTEAWRKRFGFQLFADENHVGLPIMICPETATLQVGDTEAPFAVTDLPEKEDLELRIFIDKYLVEVFANNRQAVVAAHMDYQSAKGLHGYTFGGTMTIKQIEIWRLNPTNQGFFDAKQNRVWEPDEE